LRKKGKRSEPEKRGVKKGREDRNGKKCGGKRKKRGGGPPLPQGENRREAKHKKP